MHHDQSRRQFLEFLAASPLASPAVRRLLEAGRQPDPLITDPEAALNVFEFEPVAKQKIPPAHWGYLATGVDGDETLRANQTAFARYQIRPRRLVDVAKVDPSIELFGVRWTSPIFLCPASSQRAFHPDGERAVARAAKTRQHLQLLSTVSSTAVEEVISDRGAPIWFQLYPTDVFRVTELLVRRAEAAGCPAIVLTIDNNAGRNTETDRRLARSDPRRCADCHQGVGPTNPSGHPFATKPMFRGVDTAGVTGLYSASQTWDFVARVRDLVKGKLVIKGVETGEDAKLCLGRGVDAVYVSNHGGRSVETGRGAIESLGEVVDAVRGKVPVLIDSGFRRGTDIFKALALGATAVGIGRPYLWGLGAFGQAGVEKVLDLLRAETELIMRQAGTASVGRIGRSFLIDRRSSG